jgi:hypothetical protein
MKTNGLNIYLIYGKKKFLQYFGQKRLGKHPLKDIGHRIILNWIIGKYDVRI